ncbi:hypothetical protein SBA1_100027 [Candidatus Sulfotelmatobacter kueseliae]|uniref:Bacterial Ig-like domain-containing protein n=1 Tax=Candidatus Sulfotelmatobacter kueseliae TaxID=2042962 RepID=A0A2U3JW06_9BACT|nr:hypothetical protein SBA1_100027 [Candidatus Sulfotelmatobacter kueseliae]
MTVVSPSPGGGASNTIFFPIAVPEASVSFSRTDISSAGGNITVVALDLNGDGKLDLAATTYYDSTVRIFLGNGDGTFTPGQTYSVCHAHGLATGDFNGDGITDLAVGNSGCGQITILLGNGDGTFRAGGTFETGGNGGEVEVGDFNGDGKLDLVSEGYTAAVLLGNGDGTFQAPVNYPTVAGGLVVVGDFNGDGHLDFAVGSGSDSAVSVMLGNGDGTFQPQAQYQVKGTNHGGIVLADLNQDGKLDLAVSDNEGWVSVLLGNGDGTFRTGGNYDTGGLTAGLAGADLKGDGILDLIAANYYSSSLSLLLGNGDGTFQAPFNYAAGYGARGIAVGDFNGDGRLDLAVGNQFTDSISIYLQTGESKAPTSTMVVSSLNPSLRGQAVTFTATVASIDGEIPDGEQVTFYACGTVIGTGTTSGGVATFTTSLLGVGTHSIKAAYVGDATFAPSSGMLTQIVQANTTTALVSSPNASTFGQAVVLEATVTAVAAPKPTGTVTFKDGTATLGTGILDASGVATFSTSTLSARRHLITASYGGGVHYRASTSARLTQTVKKANSTTTLASSLNPATEGQAVTFTAKVTSPTVEPTGPVTFMAGQTVLGKRHLKGGEAQFTTSTLAIGSTTVTATYGGCANIADSSASATQEVSQ